MNVADRTALSPRMVLFSGLGVDARALGPQVKAFPELEVFPWIDPLPDEPLPAYAARMARAVREAGDPDRPLYLGGLSMGGMIAVEAAQHLPNTRALLLIATAQSGAGIPAYYQPLGRGVRYVPPGVMRLLHAMTPTLLPLMGKLNAEQDAIMRSAISDVPPAFIQWAGEAIVRWRGPAAIGVPVHHIHGRLDHILPFRLAKPTQAVRGGGHLITLTHPEVMNQFLRKAMQSGETGVHVEASCRLRTK